MKFSLILCTLNRPKELDSCVNSILNQTYDNFEIIIIDQSDEENKKYIKFHDKVKYFHTNDRGLSHCRNLALSYVCGDYCCLMDDDAEFKSNTLFEIQRIIKLHKCDVVSGLIVDKNTNEKWMKTMGDKDCFVSFNNVFGCSSASLTIKTSILKKYRFDERLGAGNRWGCGEETDLLLRIMYDGYLIYYSPNIIIYHPKEQIADANLNKIYKYNLGYGAYFCKHIKIYNNKKMFFSLMYAIFKNIVAVILYLFTNKKRKYYIICIKGKVVGYFEFRKMVKKNV